MKNIIIQAGGVGKRMNGLTSVKPKCLIPIDGKPLLFHLFDSNPDSNFIIILDYFGEVIQKYIKKFRPNVKVQFVKSTIKSTAAGIKQAINLLNPNDSFYIIWSDLLVTKELNIKSSVGIGVGLTTNACSFPCRWSYKHKKLVRESSTINGVAGLFWFENSNCLKKLDESKSLTSFIADNSFFVFDVEGIDDIGTEERFYNKHKNNRFFNKLSFTETTVEKEAIVEDYKKLIKDEITWYKHVSKLEYTKIPKLLSETPFIIERLKGNNPFDTQPDSNFILNAINNIKTLHELEITPSNIKELELVYIEKTLNRVYEVSELIPFFNDDFIKINNQTYSNPFSKNNINNFKNTIKKLYDIDHFNLIHGDCTFSNMIKVGNEAFLIDPRGYFGKDKLYGDPRYDWAKLYYSFVGNYDNVNSKKYMIELEENGIQFKIQTNGWEQYEEVFFNAIPYNKNEIKLIHVLIWFSLCGYVVEDYSSILLAFYNGVVLWNEVKNEKDWI